MEDIIVLKGCIEALLHDVVALDDARDLLHAELHATSDLIGNAANMGRAAESALLALNALHVQQTASIQELDGRISALERQLALYTENYPHLVTQVTEEFGAAPGLKLGAAPEPEDDPELVAALEASLEGKQEEDAAYWAGFGVRAWQPAPAGARASMSRLVVEAELRAAALNQQPRAGVRALMAADEAFGLPSGWSKGWAKGWEDRKP